MAEIVPLKHSATFDGFWELCPKKVDKALTKAKWDAITRDGLETRTLDRDSGQYVPLNLKATPDELIEGMVRYRRTQIIKEFEHHGRQYVTLVDDGKFTAHPATWLNRGRWMDGD